MTAWLVRLSAFTGLGLAVLIATSLACWLMRPRLERLSRTWHPEDQAGLDFAVAVAPLVVPATVVALCILPGLAGALSGVGDHCAAHLDHPHFCPVHTTLRPGIGLFAVLSLGAAIAAGVASRSIALLRRAFAEQRWLEQHASGRWQSGAAVVDTNLPLAFSQGILRPRVWIASELVESLEPAEREVVLAHERAHCARRDPARLLAAQLASPLHLPAAATQILATLKASIERACDARAADAVGDRLRVAETLLRVERLSQFRTPATPIAATGLVGSTLPGRIEALTKPAPARPWTRLLPASARSRSVVVIAALLPLARPIHHLAEHALEALLRSMVGVPPLS